MRRALDVLDEETGLAYHALILLDPSGDVVYKETAGEGAAVRPFAKKKKKKN